MNNTAKLLTITAILILIAAFGNKIKAGVSSIASSLDKYQRPTWHDETNVKINTLHPAMQAKARELINRLDIDYGIRARIRSAFRSYEAQQEIYNQGRTTPGDIVTNAEPGESWHNFGLAIDVRPETDDFGRSRFAMYDIAGRVGQSLGLEWGGNWRSFVDKPHFQLTNGQDIADVRQRYENGDIDRDGYVTLA